MTENFQGPYPTTYPPQSPGPVPPWPQPPMAWAEEAESDINVMDYVRLIWARKWIVIGVAIAVVLLGTAWGLTQKKMYRAETKITIYPAPQLTQRLTKSSDSRVPGRDERTRAQA